MGRHKVIAAIIVAAMVVAIFLAVAGPAAKGMDASIHAPPKCASRGLPPSITCFDVPRGQCYVVTSKVMRSELKTISCFR